MGRASFTSGTLSRIKEREGSLGTLVFSVLLLPLLSNASSLL